MTGSLANLLLEDSEYIKKIKSLYKREEEYADFLGPIEGCILSFYLENQKLTDANIGKIVKNIRSNYAEDARFFKEPLEQAILKVSELAVKRRPISRHEYCLVLSYILWAISNRNWLGNKRAYLEWLVGFFGSEGKKSLPGLDFLPFEPTAAEEALTRKESEGFASCLSQNKSGNSLKEKPNPELQKLLVNVVSNQLRLQKPKATKEAFDRLIAKGYGEKTAKEKIAATVAEEIFVMLKNKEEFNEKRYEGKLSKLD